MAEAAVISDALAAMQNAAADANQNLANMPTAISAHVHNFAAAPYTPNVAFDQKPQEDFWIGARFFTSQGIALPDQVFPVLPFDTKLTNMGEQWKVPLTLSVAVQWSVFLSEVEKAAQLQHVQAQIAKHTLPNGRKVKMMYEGHHIAKYYPG